MIYYPGKQPTGHKLKQVAPKNQNQDMTALMVSDVIQMHSDIIEDTLPFYFFTTQIIGRKIHLKN